MQACESVMLCWKRDLRIQETIMSTGKTLSLESGGYLCEQGRMLRSEAKGKSPVLQQVLLA